MGTYIEYTSLLVRNIAPPLNMTKSGLITIPVNWSLRSLNKDISSSNKSPIFSCFILSEISRLAAYS